MKSLCRVAQWLAAALVVAVSMTAHGAGPQKQFTLRMAPTTILTANNTVTLTATFKNTTPSGNSTFNSLKLITGNAAATGLSLLSVTKVEYGTENASGVLTVPYALASYVPLVDTSDPNAQAIWISNLNPPIKPNTPNVLRVTFTASVGDCRDVHASWNATVWTGSTFSGDTFVGPLQGSQLQTSGCDAVLASCTGGYTESAGVDATLNTTAITRKPNKDGSACEEVAIAVNFTNANRTVQVQWDEATYPFLVLFTDTTWPLEPIDDPSTTTVVETWLKRTKVSWLNDSAGNPVFVEAPLCNSNASPTTTNGTMPLLVSGLPAPYNAQPAGSRYHACIVGEAFDVQDSTTCTNAGYTAPCVLVNSLMYITGDPWLSRQ